MPLPELKPDHLIVLVFGPGTGELILVRAPPDAWMVIDGCGAGRTFYAVEALEHYKARPRIIVLTHAHNDHSRGLGQLIETATPRGQKDTWPRLGMVLPPGSESAAPPSDYVAGTTQRAIDAILSRWSASPACRWEVNVGDLEQLGDATLRVLSPHEDVRSKQLARWKARLPFDKNVISTAILLSWRGRRVVLGSDLVETPLGGWSHSLTLDPELGDHDLLKVPHHGSNDALHDGVLKPKARVPSPLRVITPFIAQQLPRFSPPGEGAPRVVSHGGTTYLTGLPRAFAMQSGRIEERTLDQLEGHAAITFNPRTSGFPDCYVLVSIPPDGQPPSVEQGPGSIRVVQPTQWSASDEILDDPFDLSRD